METAALVAPVTALEFLQDSFLLSGEGPVLTVFSLHPRPKASTSLSVLQHHRIHGIRPRRSASATSGQKKDDLSSTPDPEVTDLAVFGGKAVRLLRLQDGELLRLEPLGPLMELQDWVLDVRWLSGDKHSLLCVAVAHNSALLLDTSTGNTLVQRSCLEGCLLYSALLLVHESWADTLLVGGTVFNQLVLWRPGGGDTSSDSEHKAPVERRLLGHSGVIFSISYLQEKGRLASASDDRSVRVWAVGALGGSGGKCGDLNPACLRVLYGHQARVFSVRLSSGKVFSAGEDGSCLVWDWAGGGSVSRTLKGHRAGGVRALAVSEGRGDEGSWVATGGADGGVRLWRVEGSEEREEAAVEKLTDLKCPAQSLPKVVCLAGGDKNPGWAQSKVVVCTDQGTVYQHSDGQWDVVWQGTPEFHSYSVMETKSISVRNSAAEVDLCAVGNLSGSVQLFLITHPQCGILLTGGSAKIHSLIWCEVEGSVCLLASGAEGRVHRWRVDVELDENSSFALSVDPLPAFVLPPCAKRWLTAAVRLRSTSGGFLWVCGDRRGSLLLFLDEGRKQTGDEEDEAQGSVDRVTEERESGDGALHPVSCLFGVHGKQGVTSVLEHQGLLYSSGRDGCVRVCRVSEDRDGLQLQVLRVQRACRGMEWLERVLILEPDGPAEEEQENHFKTEKMEETEGRCCRGDEGKMENKGREARFAVVGFHGVHFVVWDPVRQERLLAVPCGGGHRSWSLWPPHRGVWPGYGALVFIKQGAVMASQPPAEAPSWGGKTGRTGGRGLREGVHGRGIGCVCRLGAIRGSRKSQTGSTGGLTGPEGQQVERGGALWEVLVTGGEDTSLTVLAVRPDSGRVKVLSVITDHISSVRTVTALRRPETGSGNQTLSALLVSAGGRAQVQCYRLLIGWDSQRLLPSCQVIQVGGHRLDEQWERRRNRHKTVKMDPETRYMSAVSLDGHTDSCLLALACSDGALRLFSVSEVKHQVDLLWESFHHQRCVLSVATCSLEDRRGDRYKLLFSAATDGRIALWDLTDAPSLSSDPPAPPIPRLDIHAHQSGVNSLAVWTGRQEGGCLVTVASGGDDGQLTVSRMRVEYPEGGETELHVHLCSQLHVPLAHAAPLTALKLLSPGLLVSTSSDQRVCLWRVGGATVSHTGALCCHVADAAGLEVWEEEEEEEEEEGDEERKTWPGAEGGGPVGAASETSDPVCDEQGGETEGETEGETNTETGLKRGRTGWVLVCGQGLQLLRVLNPDVDP